jgi:hypothetical protein
MTYIGTGKRIVKITLPNGEEVEVPNPMKAAHSFINSSSENREWVAYLAVKGTITWPYSISLDRVTAYLKWRAIRYTKAPHSRAGC